MILIDDENVLGVEYKTWDNQHGLWVDVTEDVAEDFLFASNFTHYTIVDVGDLCIRKVESCHDVLKYFKKYFKKSPMQPFDYCGDHDKVKDKMYYKICKINPDLESQLLDLNAEYEETF